MSQEAMVSRSLRLRKDTLEELHELAKERGVGITVYIRMVLEALVANTINEKQDKAFQELIDFEAENGFRDDL